ncbi:MAG TPA: hypothetical protein VGP17_08755 [Solirubrobacteraceae bacterium]|jgi:hypothetical protein|nr:hypothetical protein [Solirubrobacteraceae bacterium]
MKRLVAVLFAVGCLGGATQAYAAEMPPPAVSVEGVANVAISQTANQAEANAAYRQGLAAAIGDGHEKAEFLAVSTGAKIGPIQQILERGGSIECVLPAAEGPLTEYQEYKGAEPDFGSVESAGSRFAVAPETASSTTPRGTSKPKRKKHKAKAKKASAVRCTLSAEVGLSYLLM